MLFFAAVNKSMAIAIGVIIFSASAVVLGSLCSRNDSESPVELGADGNTGAVQARDELGQRFNSDSWKALVPENCQAFFDGCNNCRKSVGPNEAAACTRKLCERYERPVCTD